MAGGEVEPWLRGTHGDVDAVRRAVLHAMEQAAEDITRWTTDLEDNDLAAQPFGLPSAAFQMRHIAHSIDRLQTYARGQALTAEQFTLLREEATGPANRQELQRECSVAFLGVRDFLLSFAEADFAEARTVGRDALPTSVAGLLIHMAEHTQRHVGQLITTAKVVKAMR